MNDPVVTVLQVIAAGWGVVLACIVVRGSYRWVKAQPTAALVLLGILVSAVAILTAMVAHVADQIGGNW